MTENSFSDFSFPRTDLYHPESRGCCVGKFFLVLRSKNQSYTMEKESLNYYGVHIHDMPLQNILINLWERFLSNIQVTWSHSQCYSVWLCRTISFNVWTRQWSAAHPKVLGTTRATKDVIRVHVMLRRKFTISVHQTHILTFWIVSYLESHNYFKPILGILYLLIVKGNKNCKLDITWEKCQGGIDKLCLILEQSWSPSEIHKSVKNLVMRGGKGFYFLNICHSNI